MAIDPRDRVELSDGRVVGGEDERPKSGLRSRPWLGVWFRCAGVYARAYRNDDGTAYERFCPKCGKAVRFAVGPGGVSDRCFEVRCGK